MTKMFYLNEFSSHEKEYGMNLSSDELGLVAKRLGRHFKVRIRLWYSGHRRGGCCDRFGNITLGSHGRNFGTLCHEVGHAIEFHKYNDSSHHKRLRKIIARVINYCRKKDYWAGERQRMLQRDEERSRKLTAEWIAETNKPKHVKAQEQIAKRLGQIKGYEKRLAYYMKLYNNKIRKARRSIAVLERYAKQPITNELPISTNLVVENELAVA